MSDQRLPGVRPAHVKAPAHLSKNTPVPAPQPMVRAEEPDPERLNPVRYGDWEISGIAIDF
jgi:hypothetical protein